MRSPPFFALVLYPTELSFVGVPVPCQDGVSPALLCGSHMDQDIFLCCQLMEVQLAPRSAYTPGRVALLEDTSGSLNNPFVPHSSRSFIHGLSCLPSVMQVVVSKPLPVSRAFCVVEGGRRVKVAPILSPRDKDGKIHSHTFLQRISLFNASRQWVMAQRILATF